MNRSIALLRELASALGKMGLILETRSKANLHNRNTLFTLHPFLVRSAARLVYPFVDSCFLCIARDASGERIARGFCQGFTTRWFGDRTSIPKPRTFWHNLRMKRGKYLEILFWKDNKYSDVFLINISFHILQHGLFNVSRECLEDWCISKGCNQG